MITVTAITADNWEAWRALRLEALRDAPYAYSSTLAQWQGDGDTEARWRRRLTDVPFNVIARLNDKRAGIVSATSPTADEPVQMISMWVAPFARGTGVGNALLESVFQWARSLGVDRIALDVFPTNRHAIALYRRHGFVEDGVIDREIRMLWTQEQQASTSASCDARKIMNRTRQLDS